MKDKREGPDPRLHYKDIDPASILLDRRAYTYYIGRNPSNLESLDVCNGIQNVQIRF